ncbi:restriction endonuclease subunit S [Stutzerimonas stutzeri]|nr:restriction endonuclease subunit S [Stutzerimonas stutzeri]UWG61204.1 restriction endonuclease subunit S [Stutzerimonas stutzeri]
MISQAVTKGLDPTVPMKDSDVEWLGEVPAHWGVKALRYLGECQNGINIGGEAFGSGSPFVSYGDVYKNDVLPAEVTGLVQSSPEDQQRYSIEYGDVFFTRTSETVDEIGFSATCLQELPNAVFAGFLIRFRPTGKSLTPGFSKYYFRNQGLRIFFNKEMNLVTRASLSQDLLKLLPVTLPPVVEQIKISDFLDRVTAEFASLLEQGIKAIDLLKERRSALISAAVTGKIDVRGWQPPANTQAPESVQEAV